MSLVPQCDTSGGAKGKQPLCYFILFIYFAICPFSEEQLDSPRKERLWSLSENALRLDGE